MKYKLPIAFAICALYGCANLEPYERVYVNDPEMQIADDSGQSFQKYVSAVREGATPATSAKSSGGCGCN
ncbi:DUF4266 domain-containing protein [Wenyingzhuangia sp. IMCC45533]